MVDREALEKARQHVLGRTYHAATAHEYDSDLVTAYLSALSDKGLRLVPREPTEEMIQAGGGPYHHPSIYMERITKEGRRRVTAIWREMFDNASPSPSETGEK